MADKCKKRTSITAAEYGTPKVVRSAIIEWLRAEEKALKQGRPSPQPHGYLEGWPVEPDASGSTDVRLIIKEYSHPRIFDPAIAAFMRLALIEQGGISLNPAKRKIEEFIPEHTCVHLSVSGKRFSLMRIIYGEEGNRHIRPIGDHHDLRRQNLWSEKPSDQPRSPDQTRADSINALVAAYDKHNSSEVNRKKYRNLLETALGLADRRYMFEMEARSQSDS